MRNFLIGSVKGLVVAGLGLGTASYLVPARVTAPAAQTKGAPEAVPDTAPEAALPKGAAPVAVLPDTAPSETVPSETAPSETEAPAAPPQLPTPPADVVPTAPSEALLDPAPMGSTGAKVATPPQPGVSVQTPTIDADPATSGTATGSTAPASTATGSTAPASTAPDTASAVAAAGTSLPPLQAFAASFAGAGGKPLFAIVLVDTGALDIDRAVWASLPFPVSFAVDPESPTAAEAVALYRAAGKEVIMLPTSLPAGAQASDVETSLAAYAAMLPQSVAVMSDPAAGFQDSRDLSSLVVPAIGAQGRGVLLFDRGLNSAAQIAQRDQIPYAMISKMIDTAGESVPVMRRYLDRAVFKAAQDGAAVVMGQTLPTTLAALTEWSLEGRAGDVTLAPISALMQPAP